MNPITIFAPWCILLGGLILLIATEIACREHAIWQYGHWSEKLMVGWFVAIVYALGGSILSVAAIVLLGR